MNTNKLKKFAQATRNKLLEQVSSRLEFVLNNDTPELREKAAILRTLRDQLGLHGRQQMVDKVAYTWFNRFVALRYLDIHEYQPLGIMALTALPGQLSPQLLQEAMAGNIPAELHIDRQKVMSYLDGKITSKNAENDAYRLLLIAACNHLNKIFPFLFEKIDDYTELLMPDDLTSEFSILHDVQEGMDADDCREVECIGWLYQFYISEKKDEVFASKEKVKKEDIPAATQLFTPRWIVEYMVQNTVGKLWLMNHPESGLKAHMPYYIESEASKSAYFLKINSPEELTLLDQACGSGHILVYGFELLYKIYEEQGYNPGEIPALIIQHNLYGMEIDERAAQLAGMAVLMKAREYQARLFKKAEVPAPNITCYQDLPVTSDNIKAALTSAGIATSKDLLQDLEYMRQATNLGSLILPATGQYELVQVATQLKKALPAADLYNRSNLEEIAKAIEVLGRLRAKYCCVVDNPPYMGGGNMNKELGDYVKDKYLDSKADLMACFMEAGLNALMEKGMLGMINQHSWMFLSSYEKLRMKLIDNYQFDTLLHLGPRTFPEIGGEIVQNAAFSVWNNKCVPILNGIYLRLVDLDSTESKRLATIEAAKCNTKGLYYSHNQKEFDKIPSSPIGYWLSDKFLNLFTNNPCIEDLGFAVKGLDTGRDEQYIRLWTEIEMRNSQLSSNSNVKWHFYKKGGAFRKWFGNYDFMVFWENDGIELRNFRNEQGKIKSRPQNISFYYKKGLEWSRISSNTLSVRVIENSIFGGASSALFLENNNNYNYLLAFSNSKIIGEALKILNPTLVFQVGDIKRCPIKFDKSHLNEINEIVDELIEISKNEWNSRETSWDFKVNELLKVDCQELEESYDLYQQYWKNKFYQLHKNEEELNRQFIEIYGLQDELTPYVPLEEITILKEETSIENGQLVFHGAEVFAQFVSYAVGCMFGRYSLDKEGLILASAGEMLEDYYQKIEKDPATASFTPDKENIIPLLEDEWFEDDIVLYFYKFLKATFGEKNFRKNLAFVEEQLGMDMRKYFLKSFYTDHVQRYKKRPIYWQFSSPKGYFNVLVYLHRYTPDTLNNILNNYLRQFIEKLNNKKENLKRVEVSGTPAEKTKAIKEMEKIALMLADCHDYERNTLYPLATERIKIDLDNGVLVNYNCFGKAIKEIKGLNDTKTKNEVRKFDWIDGVVIR